MWNDPGGDVVALLLNYHCSPNNLGSMRMTPLHLAAKYGYENTVQLLLQAGASTRLTDALGRLPIQMAATPAIRQLLKNAYGLERNADGSVGFNVLGANFPAHFCAPHRTTITGCWSTSTPTTRPR